MVFFYERKFGSEIVGTQTIVDKMRKRTNEIEGICLSLGSADMSTIDKKYKLLLKH